MSNYNIPDEKNIPDDEFKRIFDDKQLFLPMRWDGNDFLKTVERLLDYYKSKFENKSNCRELFNDIERICNGLEMTLQEYLKGFPAKAYAEFEKVMGKLRNNSLKVYQKTSYGEYIINFNDVLSLFRVVNVEDNRTYDRKRVFHTPYNLRSKVSSSRYSIAGYPSLYLGTTLKLCCAETANGKKLSLASMFKICRNFSQTGVHIEVIELGIKPQDFIEVFSRRNFEDDVSREKWEFKRLLMQNDVKNAYCFWYPLIACCSYIRVNKKDPFAPEYIIPQLLMQWVRNEMCYNDGKFKKLMGIRYFSCASIKASKMGFNYVFPTSGEKMNADSQYCDVLSKTFVLTKPVYIRDFDSIEECEQELKRSTDLDLQKI